MRRIRPKIKWSSRKKNSVIPIRKRQRGGFITALVTMGSNALAAAGPRIAQIVGESLPAIFGGIRGAARGVITEVPTAAPVVVRTLADLAGTGAPRNLASIGVAFAASAAAAAIGVASVYGPRLIDGLFRSGQAISGSAPAARGVAKISAETARAAGDELGAAVTEAVAEASVKTPVLTSPLPPAFIRSMTGTQVRACIKTNKDAGTPLKMPAGVTVAKLVAEESTRFKTMVLNGRVQGSPAEILAEASEILGEAEATALLAPEANPAIAAERAAIEAIPPGPDRLTLIAERAGIQLEQAAIEEANMVAQARGTANGTPRNTAMNNIINLYESLFGGHPEQLVRDMALEPAEIGRFMPGDAVPAYNVWLPSARTFFQNQLTPDERANFRSVMTPQIMSQFRQGMLRLFLHSPGEAEAVFEGFVLHVIPAIAQNGRGLFVSGNNRQILANFLNTMRQNPAGVRIALQELIERLTNQAITIQGAAGRTLGTLPARLLTLAIRGTLAAASGLFIVSFQGTPNGGGFGTGLRNAADAIRDRLYEWFGIQLWQSPTPDDTWAGQLAAAAGFEGPNAVQEWGRWIAGQARGWLWRFMGAILISLGLTAGAAATWIVQRFGGTPNSAPDGTPTTPVIPPAVDTEITEEELLVPNNNGGFRRNQRNTRRNR